MRRANQSEFLSTLISYRISCHLVWSKTGASGGKIDIQDVTKYTHTALSQWGSCCIQWEQPAIKGLLTLVSAATCFFFPPNIPSAFFLFVSDTYCVRFWLAGQKRLCLLDKTDAPRRVVGRNVHRERERDIKKRIRLLSIGLRFGRRKTASIRPLSELGGFSQCVENRWCASLPFLYMPSREREESIERRESNQQAPFRLLISGNRACDTHQLFIIIIIKKKNISSRLINLDQRFQTTTQVDDL